MTDDNIAIKASGIKKSFKDVEVLKGIDLRVPKGSVLALLGPNGAGKTTMVRILTTLLKADGGEAWVGGYSVAGQPDKIQSTIGLAGQYASVDGQLTGLENLRMIGRLYHLSKHDARARAEELLKAFNLVQAGNRPVKNYSGGMRRRLDLAASLLVVPPILFLDEPTTGLDPKSRNDTWNIIRDLVDGGMTLLLTTQYLDEADQLADNIAVINDGLVIAEGTPDELKSQVGGERLDVVVNGEADFEKARKYFGKRLQSSDTDSLTLYFSLDKGSKGLKQVSAITTDLADQNIGVTDFITHRPTLDDVFLKLTDTSKPKPKGKKT